MPGQTSPLVAAVHEVTDVLYQFEDDIDSGMIGDLHAAASQGGAGRVGDVLNYVEELAADLIDKITQAKQVVIDLGG